MYLYKNVVLYLLVNNYKIYQEGKYHMIRQGENQENKKGDVKKLRNARKRKKHLSWNMQMMQLDLFRCGKIKKK